MKRAPRDCEGCTSAPPGVEPENGDAWEVFAASATQWRTAGQFGLPSGLDYAAADVLRRAFGLESGRDLWDRVRVLEGAALDEMRRQRERDRGRQ